MPSRVSETPVSSSVNQNISHAAHKHFKPPSPAYRLPERLVCPPPELEQYLVEVTDVATLFVINVKLLCQL